MNLDVCLCDEKECAEIRRQLEQQKQIELEKEMEKERKRKVQLEQESLKWVL